MGGSYHLDAGPFSQWLHGLRRALTEGGETNVPCGDCSACCSSSWFIHIRPTDERALALVPAEFVFPAAGRPEGHVVMGYDKRGRCPMLDGEWCTIYEDRPLTCRYFDCRVFPAAGIDAGCADSSPLTARIRRWRFSYPTPRDRAEHDAVRSAAAFLRSHTAYFPDGELPLNPTAVASVAIKVYDVFLDDGQGTRTDDQCARAVRAARKRFEAARCQR